MYKHKSGAQKRKEKQTREANAKSGSRTLFQVGVSISNKNSDGKISYLIYFCL